MPRRWTESDSDESRLPQGLVRVGYDADERRYYFCDEQGQMWRSQSGNQYGTLTLATPEPPVTIPRRPRPPPPPPHSEEPTDDPSKGEPTSVLRSFTGPYQITTSSSTLKRSHTINIPSVSSLKRSSTAAASFIRSRGKRFIKPGHSNEPSHDDDSQRPPLVTDHRRTASTSMTIRRSAIAVTAYLRGKKKPRADPVDGNPQPLVGTAD